MRRGSKMARIDNIAKTLIAYAKSLGFDYEGVNGTFDGVLVWGTTAICVDWKSKGGTLTPTQQRLVARGFPLRFIQTPAQLDALRAELMPVRQRSGDPRCADPSRCVAPCSEVDGLLYCDHCSLWAGARHR